MFGFRRAAPVNIREGRCASCSRVRRLYDLDGTGLRMCLACIGSVVEEAGALNTERERLYEGAGWSRWTEIHDAHRATPTVGCPLCGMQVAG